MQNDEQTVRHSEQGFTIIEILVSTVIVSVIMVVLITVYLTAYRGYDRANTINLIQEEGNRITNVLTRNIHASAKAEMNGSDLVLELDEDTLEYQENGECSTITIQHTPPTPSTNGSIKQIYSGCNEIVVVGGTYENVITNDGSVTAVNVTNFSTSVANEGTQRTYLVTVQFVLGQAVGVNNRGNYGVLVPFDTKIATRGYIN